MQHSVCLKNIDGMYLIHPASWWSEGPRTQYPCSFPTHPTSPLRHNYYYELYVCHPPHFLIFLHTHAALNTILLLSIALRILSHSLLGFAFLPQHYLFKSHLCCMELDGIFVMHTWRFIYPFSCWWTVGISSFLTGWTDTTNIILLLVHTMHLSLKWVPRE